MKSLTHRQLAEKIVSGIFCMSVDEAERLIREHVANCAGLSGMDEERLANAPSIDQLEETQITKSILRETNSVLEELADCVLVDGGRGRG